MFRAAVFKIAKTWKQPKYPLTGEWIKKMWYVRTMHYYSTIKRKNKAICSHMNATIIEIITLNEISQKWKGKYHMISLICGI